MEKFSNWRDKATGISPFMPFPFPHSASKGNNSSSSSNTYKFITSSKFNAILYKFILFCTKLPIFLTKVPFFIIVSTLYTLTGFKLFLTFTFTFLFGFNPIEIAVDGVKSSQRDKLQSYRPKRGELVIANYSSPLDGYIIASVCQSSSNIVILVPDKQGDLYQYTPWSLIDHCFNQIQGKGPVEDVSKLKDKLVVLLLEGTTSNNSALLPFIKLNDKYTWDDFDRVKSLVIKLYPNYFTLPIPYISSLYYLYQLLTDFTRKNARVKIYDFDNTGNNNNNNNNKGTKQLDISKIRRTFELNSLNLINQDLSIDAKARFIDYYFNHSVK
ncbi:hypothetical protein CANMA_001934 [Candida margitis]|uniref:uncharacterized protein n=1 Tax=Candida margitis TaxID=1775924 RepID=UPI002225FBEE|nr:uncharacterized protein CANMA_001934 [Candida margitis]KAI5969044.1 hypothetical protein CANMA_001934 [Candida margitis]